MTLEGCAVKPVAFTSSDPDFAVNTDGTIFTVHGLEITIKRFSVLVQDENGSEWRVDIVLSCKDEVKLQPVILNYKPYDLDQQTEECFSLCSGFRHLRSPAVWLTSVLREDGDHCLSIYLRMTSLHSQRSWRW